MVGLSLEKRFFHGALVAAMVGSVVLAKPDQVVGSGEPPLPCGNAEIYPDELPPAEGEYEIVVPKENACAIAIYYDRYRSVFLAVYPGKTEILVYEASVGRYFVQATGVLPEDGGVVEFSWNQIEGTIAREGDVYRIKYAGSVSESTPEEQSLLQICSAPWIQAASFDGWNQGSCLVERTTGGESLDLVLVVSEDTVAWLHFSANGPEESVILFVKKDGLTFAPAGGVAPGVGETVTMEHSGLRLTIIGLEKGVWDVEYSFQELEEKPPKPTDRRDRSTRA